MPDNKTPYIEEEEYKFEKFKTHREYCQYLKKNKIRFGPFYESGPIENVITKASDNYDAPKQIFKNNLYQVSMFEADLFIEEGEWPEMWHLSIKRLDRNAFHDWRDMQRIKNEIIGVDNEGVELFPMERRLVDSANQYHMFVIKDSKVPFPFGFRTRLVDDGEACGTKQRPWRKGERPPDATHMTDEELLSIVKSGGEKWHPSVADGEAVE
jgi:hypothetical protein